MIELKGKLQRWNDEKGFGFIAPENQNQGDIFLHISELKNMSRRPVNGDVIFYQVYTDNNGKTKAINARIEGGSFVKQGKKSTPKQEKNTLFGTIVSIIFLSGIVWFVFGKFKAQTLEANQDAINQPVYEIPKQKAASEDSLKNTTDSKPNYQCDGRQHCSQMTSCEEAMFFLKNCPDTKMDGDEDGIPCEDQWCGH
jgi:cold shock CspA family protein